LISIPFFLVGGAAWARFVYLYFMNESGIARHIQSVTIGTGLLVLGALILLFGLLADIANKHRQLTHLVLYRMRKLESRLFDGGEGITVKQIVSERAEPFPSARQAVPAASEERRVRSRGRVTPP
jgi:hypothetical protein